MEDGDSKTGDSWPQAEPRSLEQLVACIKRVLESGGGVSKVAWRGHADRDWTLVSTLDRDLRGLDPEMPYETRLAYERELLKQFRNAALTYASESEKPHLQSDWEAMAVARHAGLATRLLDWTFSPWAALWFASHDRTLRESDGLLWWFDTRAFNKEVGSRWDEKYKVGTKAKALGIPKDHELAKRFRLDERYLDLSAFAAPGAPWICQLHYRFPCSRMAAQQGFATVCGRLGLPHDEAIDALGDPNDVPRGKIFIPANLKADALVYLANININAASLEYPALDNLAGMIMDRLRAGEIHPSSQDDGEVPSTKQASGLRLGDSNGVSTNTPDVR